MSSVLIFSLNALTIYDVLTRKFWSPEIQRVSEFIIKILIFRMNLSVILLLVTCPIETEATTTKSGVATRVVQGAKRFISKVKRSKTTTTSSTSNTAVAAASVAAPDQRSFLGKAVDVFTGGSLLTLGGAELYKAFTHVSKTIHFLTYSIQLANSHFRTKKRLPPTFLPSKKNPIISGNSIFPYFKF